jgi:hypothetical protein
MTIETVGRVKIECRGNTLSGQFTGTRTANISLVLTGCEPSNHLGIKCESQGAQSGEVALAALHGYLGMVVSGPEPEVGMQLGAGGPELAQFGCGGVSVALTGDVIAELKPLDKMTSAFSVVFKAEHGIQTPEAFEGGPGQALGVTLGEESLEPAGLKAADRANDQEYLEIRAIS